jgi:hypothetical protein
VLPRPGEIQGEAGEFAALAQLALERRYGVGATFGQRVAKGVIIVEIAGNTAVLGREIVVF